MGDLVTAPRRPKVASHNDKPGSSSPYLKADPSLSRPRWIGRFYRPLCLMGFGLLFIGFDLAFLAASHVHRFGVTMLIVGFLWTTAIGFALGTLRAMAALTVVLVIFLLVDVGGGAQDRVSAAEYRSLRGEIDIELNVLRGARTTRGQVTERLLSSAASYLAGAQAIDDIKTTCVTLRSSKTMLAGAELDDSDKTAVEEFLDASLAQLSDLQGEITDRLGPTKAAVDNGWKTLGSLSESPLEAAPAPASGATESDETARTTCASVDLLAQDEPPGPATTVGSDADPLVDPQADEPAGARARQEMALAQDGAQSIDTAVRGFEELHGLLTTTGLMDAGSLGEIPSLPELRPSEPATGDSGTCSVEASVSSDFDNVTARAEACVNACSGGEGACLPAAAKTILLRGFQEQLAILTKGEDVGESQAALTERLSEIRTLLDSQDDPVAIHTLVAVGADEILGDSIRVFTADDGRPARLGGWGWLVLTIAAIIGYRFLEIANDRRSPGPVLVRPGDSTQNTKVKTAAATELVRAHLTAANLQEPSPLPGGEAVSSISSSTETAGFENEVIRYVMSLLQTTAFPRRGVDLVVTTQPIEGPAARATLNEDPGPQSREPYRLMVRATNTRHKSLTFSHPFEGDSLEEVTLAAAYFAAERLLDAGWTTPSWLVWSSHDGTALRSYRDVMIDKQNPPQLRRPPTKPSGDGSTEPTSGVNGTEMVTLTDRDRLSRAVRSSPGTGAALVALSHEAALEGDLAAALHHLLLARIRHERFLTVRYRLGVTLSMVAVDIDKYWRLEDGLLPDRLGSAPVTNYRAANHVHGSLDLLEQLVDSWPSSRHQLTSERISRLLLELAIKELGFVVDAVRYRRILWRTRRQDEREYWLGIIRSSRRRRGLAGAALSASALAQQRLDQAGGNWAQDGETNRLVETDVLGDPTARNVQALHRSPDDWLVHYNAACFAAAQYDQCRRRAASNDIDDGNGDAKDAAAKQEDAGSHYAEEGFDQLRRARYARNGQQLSLQWTFVDPDLSPLRAYCNGDDDIWRNRLAGVFQLDRRTVDEELEQLVERRAGNGNGDRADIG